MKKFAFAAAIALAFSAAPANAAFSFSLERAYVEGTTTTTLIRTGECGVIGICSEVTTRFATDISGPFQYSPNSFERLDGSYTLTGYRPDTRIGYTATFDISGGQISPFSFIRAQGGYTSGVCCDDFTVVETDAVGTNFSVRVFDSTTNTSRVLAPIPEPTSWALMLAGFGGIGFAMRRQRRSKMLLEVA